MYSYDFVRTRGKDKTTRKRPKKDDRILTVSSVSGYQYKGVPALRISGLWLEDYGFHKGDKVSVHCEEGKLVIVKSEDK